MKTFLYLLSALSVIGLAYWAYGQNYQTQEAIAEVGQLHRDIGAAHERLSVLRAEWAYLNRPDRLMDLADLNYDRLGLLPLMPEAFGSVERIAFPLPPLSPITDPVEIAHEDGVEFP